MTLGSVTVPAQDLRDRSTARGRPVTGGWRRALLAAVPVRLGRFALERFPPAAYGPLIVAFLACGLVGSALEAGVEPPLGPGWGAAAAVVTLVFFRLRIADELKDAAVDRLGRPDRPLPRGLVTASELRAISAGCVVLEVALAATLGGTALAAYVAVLVYTLLAGVDFFAGPRLHRNLVVYALAHAPVVPLLLGFVWWTQPGAQLSPGLAGLGILALGVTLGVEVSRKTVAPPAELPYVETYSAALGLSSAVNLAAATLALGALGGVLYTLSIGAPVVIAYGLLAAAFCVVGAGLVLRRPSQVGGWQAIASAFALALLLLPVAIVALERGVPE